MTARFGYLPAAGAQWAGVGPSRLLSIGPCDPPDLFARPDLEHSGHRCERAVHDFPVHPGELLGRQYPGRMKFTRNSLHSHDGDKN